VHSRVCVASDSHYLALVQSSHKRAGTKRRERGRKVACRIGRITVRGQPFEYQTYPTMPHSMHGADAERHAQVLIEWAGRLPSEDAIRLQGVFANT